MAVYYAEANLGDLRRFFDLCLKGETHGCEQTPRVRYSVLEATCSQSVWHVIQVSNRGRSSGSRIVSATPVMTP
jgi:hypothetical protein